MMSSPAVVLGMGFDPQRVDWALHASGNSGLQSALDHLEANQDNPVPDFKSQPAASSTARTGGSDDVDEEEQAALMEMLKTQGQGAVDAAVGGGDAAQAKSIKCSDCGKVMREALVSFHAEKSGHTNFEESTEEVSCGEDNLTSLYSDCPCFHTIDQAFDGGGEEGEIGTK